MSVALHPIWDAILKVLSEPTTSEVVINGYNEIFYRHHGKNDPIDVEFESQDEYESTIDDNLIPLIRTDEKWDGAKYLFEGSLVYDYGDNHVQSRCHIGLPPLTTTPQITMTRRSESLVSLETIASKGSMSTDMYKFLLASIRAGLNIVISGSSGSGKALHKDTPILTVNRGWSTMGALEVGDVVYNEVAEPTEVLRKYCPMDPMSFTVYFDRGKIKASAGHLWLVEYKGTPQKVSVLNKDGHMEEVDIEEGSRCILETQTMYDLLSVNTKPSVFSIQGLTETQTQDCLNVDIDEHWESKKEHEIIDIRCNGDNPADYYCIEVESPSHLFLAGEHLIPTHNTTALAAMAEHFDKSKRIGLAEDVPELVLPVPNTTSWCSYPEKPGRSKDDVATLEFVVRQFQRNRCDQLIVGETRGPEFFSFLTAANSGLSGCMTTLHADSPVEALSKMTQFATQGAPMLPVRAINQKIATCVDLIVQVTRAKGKYRTTHIQEVVPTLGINEDAKITTATLYSWDEATDKFRKENNISDGMRKRFIEAGQDMSFHLRAGEGEMMPAMGSAVSDSPNTNKAPTQRPILRPGNSPSRQI